MCQGRGGKRWSWDRCVLGPFRILHHRAVCLLTCAIYVDKKESVCADAQVYLTSPQSGSKYQHGYHLCANSLASYLMATVFSFPGFLRVVAQQPLSRPIRHTGISRAEKVLAAF